MQTRIRVALLVLVVMTLTIPFPAFAAPAGHFTLVTGEVDVLKQGKIPGLPVKLRDAVDIGDVIRTKSRGKAELTMVDDSIIRLAPESRLALADYQYDPARVERRAVVRIFRGMVQTVVNRIIKTEEPDFIIETHTATIGVRGSNPYFLLLPAFTSVYLPQGLLGISSNLPTIPFLVMLGAIEFTQIPLGKQPFLPQPMTMDMVRILEQLMNTGLVGGGLLGPGQTPAPPESRFQFPQGLPASPDRVILQQTIPPTVVPPQLTPAPASPPAHHAPSGSSSITPGPSGS